MESGSRAPDEQGWVEQVGAINRLMNEQKINDSGEFDCRERSEIDSDSIQREFKRLAIQG